MKKVLVLVVLAGVLGACATEEGGVVNKVLSDWGLRSKPEGYVSDSDKVMDKLNPVGAAEIKRLNLAEQQGKVKFQSEGELKGKYYKEVKVYESFFPIEAQADARSTDNDRTYHGYIEYAYRLYQSPRKDTSAEAEAESASIPTDTIGRDTFRYTFGSGGEWDGGKGERSHK